MKVAILSYPMLFQRKGGLQIQIKETIAELNQLGIQAELINPVVDKLEEYDLVHVFSAINGNYRLVEAAKSFAKPVVISPLVRPDWTKLTGIREWFLDRLVGKLSSWHIKTTYHEIDYCLKESDFIVALGDIEKKSIIDAFNINSEKIKVIPNGIPHRFFEAKSDLFVEKYGVEPGFVLCVAAINSHKNQLALVEAIKNNSNKVVLIGQCLETDKDYLNELLQHLNVIYVGEMDYEDPLLASAYAAAGVFCLPSYSEVMPLCVLEAMATGTPVVMTKHHCMNVSAWDEFVIQVEPSNRIEIQKAVDSLLKTTKSSAKCQQLVKEFSWADVAESILDIYNNMLD